MCSYRLQHFHWVLCLLFHCCLPKPACIFYSTRGGNAYAPPLYPKGVGGGIYYPPGQDSDSAEVALNLNFPALATNTGSRSFTSCVFSIWVKHHYVRKERKKKATARHRIQKLPQPFPKDKMCVPSLGLFSSVQPSCFTVFGASNPFFWVSQCASSVCTTCPHRGGTPCSTVCYFPSGPGPSTDAQINETAPSTPPERGQAPYSDAKLGLRPCRLLTYSYGKYFYTELIYLCFL